MTPLPTTTKRVTPPPMRRQNKKTGIIVIACKLLKKSKESQHSENDQQTKEHSETSTPELEDLPTPSTIPDDIAVTECSQGSSKRGALKGSTKLEVKCLLLFCHFRIISFLFLLVPSAKHQFFFVNSA